MSEPVRCVECHRRLPMGKRPTWFTCSFCGQPVCVDCRQIHVPICWSTVWGMAKKKDEEIVPVEKPPIFRIG